MTPPPKVLVVIREFLKPGKGGSPHEKAESAFVQAFARAKWPTHYFAANSVSGKNRALFFVPYDSFEAWEKDNQAQQKNPALSAALDRASVGDGELLSETDTSLLVYNEEQSLRAPVDIAHMRYFEISLFRVRSGHRKEWSDAVKLVKEAYEKVPDMHWAMFEAVYGQEDVTYIVIQPMKSLAEVDQLLIQSERKLTNSEGLPNRPWFKHQLYAPGFYTGYAVKTVPAVREAIEQKQWKQADEAIVVVAAVLRDEAALISSAAAKLAAK